MTNFIFLIVGLVIGGFVGVAVMCCLQINRLYSDSPTRKEDADYEKDS